MRIKARLFAIATGGSVLFNASVFAGDVSLKTDDQKSSYAAGVRIGESIKRNGSFDIDDVALSQGISDVLKGRDLKLSQEEMAHAFELMESKRGAARAAKAEQAKVAGKDFLAANKVKPGMHTLDSGIQYKVITEGSGAKPTIKDSVVVHYRGTHLDGTEFDSSYSRGEPAVFSLERIIDGWRQVLPLMPVGSKWQVFIPPEFAYGANGAGSEIGPNETLVFDIELVSIAGQR